MSSSAAPYNGNSPAEWKRRQALQVPKPRYRYISAAVATVKDPVTKLNKRVVLRNKPYTRKDNAA